MSNNINYFIKLLYYYTKDVQRCASFIHNIDNLTYGDLKRIEYLQDSVMYIDMLILKPDNNIGKSIILSISGADDEGRPEIFELMADGIFKRYCRAIDFDPENMVTDKNKKIEYLQKHDSQKMFNSIMDEFLPLGLKIGFNVHTDQDEKIIEAHRDCYFALKSKGDIIENIGFGGIAEKPKRKM